MSRYIELIRKVDELDILFRVDSIDQVYVDDEGATIILTSRKESWRVTDTYDRVKLLLLTESI